VAEDSSYNRWRNMFDHQSRTVANLDSQKKQDSSIGVPLLASVDGVLGENVANLVQKTSHEHWGRELYRSWRSADPS